MYQPQGHTATMCSSHAGPLGLCPDGEARAGRVATAQGSGRERGRVGSASRPPTASGQPGGGISALPVLLSPCMPLRLLGPGFLVSAVGQQPCSTPAAHGACCVSSTGLDGPFPASSPYLADRKGMGVNQL